MRSHLFAVVTLLAGCGAPSASPPTPAAKAAPAILTGAEGQRLLDPCSRPGPRGVNGLWTPSPHDIDLLESRLPLFLAMDAPYHPNRGPTHPLTEYRAQYAGFLRQGQRWLYASYVLAGYAETDSLFRVRAALWCGGGGAFFAIEHRIGRDQWTGLARNNEGEVVLARADSPPVRPSPHR